VKERIKKNQMSFERGFYDTLDSVKRVADKLDAILVYLQPHIGKLLGLLYVLLFLLIVKQIVRITAGRQAGQGGK
jgi:hypothetical protein